MGKVESLCSAVCFVDAYFREICESNLVAVKYMVKNYQMPVDVIKSGVISSWRARKRKIASHLLLFLVRDHSSSDRTKFVTAYLKTFLSIFDIIRQNENNETLYFALTMLYDYIIQNKWFVRIHPKFAKTLQKSMLSHIDHGFNGVAQYTKLFDI